MTFKTAFIRRPHLRVSKNGRKHLVRSTVINLRAAAQNENNLELAAALNTKMFVFYGYRTPAQITELVLKSAQ